MKFCQYCGAKLDDEASFCSSCGSNLSGPAKRPPAVAQKSDPALTKNIVLILIFVILTLFLIVPGSVGGADAMPMCATYLCIGAVLAYFAIRPSDDHIDTDRMNLLKTIESFGVSALYLITSFFIDPSIALLYQAFVLGFALLTGLKIKKIDMAERNAAERVILAFTIIVAVISCCAAMTFFTYIITE